MISFPNRESESGKLLDAYLKSTRGQAMSNEAVHLLFALNRWEMKSKILEMMSNGTNVICDRYAYSGIVYSAAKVSDHQSLKLKGPELRLVYWGRQRPNQAGPCILHQR